MSNRMQATTDQVRKRKGENGGSVCGCKRVREGGVEVGTEGIVGIVWEEKSGSR